MEIDRGRRNALSHQRGYGAKLGLGIDGVRVTGWRKD
jgi:hypothetical protein